MNTDIINNFLVDLNAAIKAESDVKIKKALGLFMRIDNQMKSVVLIGSGIKSNLNARKLREYFENCELMDSLDDLIFDMEYDLEASS